MSCVVLDISVLVELASIAFIAVAAAVGIVGCIRGLLR